jgi:hypothetical protein
MDTQVIFLDCPEYLDTQGTARCGLPAEVLYRYNSTSTDGPLESVKISCARGHWFNGAIESLAVSGQAAGSRCISPPSTTSDHAKPQRGRHAVAADRGQPGGGEDGCGSC